MDSNSIEAALKELIPFLSSNRVDIRGSAVELLAGLSGDIQGRKELQKFQFLPALIQLFGDNKKISINCLKTLVNLSTETFFVAQMIGEFF